MAIKSTKIEENKNHNIKCDNCGNIIRIGGAYYLEKNDTPIMPQVDKLGFYICEECHKKDN